MQNEHLVRANLRTPKAAAIAGMLFSLLLIAVFSLLRISVPADPQEPGSWLRTNSNTIALALNLVPFAGIAFLWFIGVLRDRLGALEDRFFATVFLGSGLLFLSMLFTAAAAVGGILMAFAAQQADQLRDVPFRPSRHVQPREYLHDQNGRSIHDYRLNACDLYRVCITLVGHPWLRISVVSSNWKLLHELELCCFPAVGIIDEFSHSEGQHSPFVRGCTVGQRIKDPSKGNLTFRGCFRGSCRSACHPPIRWAERHRCCFPHFNRREHQFKMCCASRHVAFRV